MYAFSLARKYCDEVANPMEMIIFRKYKVTERTRNAIRDEFEDVDDIAELFQGDVKKYF